MKVAANQDLWVASFLSTAPDAGFRQQVARALDARLDSDGLDAIILGVTGDHGFLCEWRLGRTTAGDWVFSMDSHRGATRWSPRDGGGAERFWHQLGSLADEHGVDEMGCVTGAKQAAGLFIRYEAPELLLFRGFANLREAFVSACEVDERVAHAARIRAMRVRMGLCEGCGEVLSFFRRVVLRRSVCPTCRAAADASAPTQ